MWILPKKIQSLTSVSVLDTKESEKDLEEFCQMSEKSLMWRSKPSQLRTWLRRWKRNNWMQHLSIRTLKSSHTESFVDKWTSYLEDSLANHSLKLELEKLQKTQDTSSLTSQKESESANQELFSSKMSKESSQQKPQMENQFLDMSSEHWKDWVTKQRLEYSQRVKSASHIKEKEFTSWGTPKEQDSRAAMTDRGKHNLGEQVHGMHNQNYPTPTSRDWKGAYSKESQENKPRNLLPDAVGENTQQDQTNLNTNGKPLVSLKLNPDWVEQLMGIPVGWTDFDFSEME